jgi:DNA topoisomerase-2
MNQKQKYVKKDQISHILDRPDTYVGSTDSRIVEDYVVVNENFNIEKKSISVSPAIIRMFIEPLSNVIDNVARSKQAKNPTTKIKINIDKDGMVSFENDGEVVSIEIHEEEKCYNHTLIFGQLLTGSNYNDEEDRLDISGRNGIGIKAVNVFSKEFIVEGVDPENKKSLKQIWKNNMRTVEKAIVKKSSSGGSPKGRPGGFTRVSYLLDFERFGLTSYTDDIISLYKRYVVDACMITKIPIELNGEKIPVSNLVEYAKLYKTDDIDVLEGDTEDIDEEEKEEDEKTPSRSVSVTSTKASTKASTNKNELLFIKTQDCEVVLIPSKSFNVISFANGIFTPQGGTHVDAWTEAIFRPIIQKLNKPKIPPINITDVKNFFTIFVVATVKQPKFDSQSKLKLEHPKIEAVMETKNVNKILKWSVIENIRDIIRTKELLVMKKSERKKRTYEKVEGLDSANFEGGKKGRDCILVFVEGLSAKSYIVQGISKGVFGKKGRDYIGIYALRGKVLNTRKAKPSTISKNTVITDMIKALNLQFGVDYTNDENFNTLRYGKVLIVCDADVDGIHITSLLQNFFHSLFPTLLQRKECFLTSMQTPIVRVFQGKKDILFYSENEFEKYIEGKDSTKIKKKYYKGLGSSNKDNVKETFGVKTIEFVMDEKTPEVMNKTFNKDTMVRKEWLSGYDKNKTALLWEGDKEEMLTVPISEYIDKELIKFSIRDCKRSLPNLIDGLKEGHRKVLFSCFKRKLNWTKETIKVSQLAGYVSEHSAYHHGEKNLHDTITNMGCDYIGSNNIPLLYRDGFFGSRIEGGKDAGDGRYIYTKLDFLTRYIFREEDDSILNYLYDDGECIEPEFYVPIIPMILVNGIIAGIGTGYSCNVPSYNPLELINLIQIWLKNEDTDDFPKLIPWYRKHTGVMKESPDSPEKFISYGKIEEVQGKGTKGKKSFLVSELPVSLWTSKFRDFLDSLKEEKKIVSYNAQDDDEIVNFTIVENEDFKCTIKNLKLTKSFSTTNMVLFNDKGVLKKYKNINEIVDTFCKVRLEFYKKRKESILKSLLYKLLILKNKKHFLEDVQNGNIELFKEKQSRKEEEIIKELENKKYDKDPDTDKYDYLLTMKINNFTEENINKIISEYLKVEEEKNKLLSITEKEMWISELEEFKNAYEKWLQIPIKKDIEKKEVKKNKRVVKS